jgi:hypothetical protein
MKTTERGDFDYCSCVPFCVDFIELINSIKSNQQRKLPLVKNLKEETSEFSLKRYSLSKVIQRVTSFQI